MSDKTDKNATMSSENLDLDTLAQMEDAADKEAGKLREQLKVSTQSLLMELRDIDLIHECLLKQARGDLVKATTTFSLKRSKLEEEAELECKRIKCIVQDLEEREERVVKVSSTNITVAFRQSSQSRNSRFDKYQVIKALKDPKPNKESSKVTSAQNEVLFQQQIEVSWLSLNKGNAVYAASNARTECKK